MSRDSLSEDEMRAALFGPANAPTPVPTAKVQESATVKTIAAPKPALRTNSKSKPLSPKLRVTLRVTKEFEGVEELFVYEADTLSTILAEQQARAEAKKKKFRYFELVEVKPV